jgi:hypothetical protein
MGRGASVSPPISPSRSRAMRIKTHIKAGPIEIRELHIRVDVDEKG